MMHKLLVFSMIMVLLSGCQSSQSAEPEKLVKTFKSSCENFDVNEQGQKYDFKPPIVRIQPKYPIHAARRRIEGYVKLAFDISPRGEPVNIHIIESYPETVFNYEAQRALSKWRFRPRIVNKHAVLVKCKTVQLDFNIR